MLAFVEKIALAFWSVIGRIGTLLMPFLAKKGWFRGVGKGLYWILHVLMVAAVLVGLYWLNWRYELWRVLKVDESIGQFFLPILFVLVYILGWLGWWLWSLLRPEEDTSDFPDIDAAWEEAVYTLNQAGIDVREAPLFVVLGKTAEPEESLFGVSQLRITVKKAPRRPDAPLRVYASRDGVFVTCPGASLLGRQASLLGSDDFGAEALVGGEGGAASDEEMFKTLGKDELKGAIREIQEVFNRAKREGRRPDQLTEEERQEIRRLEAEDKVELAQKARKNRPALLKSAVEVERHSRRLQRVCQLIQRDRRPYCPINGVLVLVPYGGTDSDEDANQTGGVIQYDLATLRRTFQLNFPIFGMVCDIERIPGFRDFAERIPEDQRQRRVGQRFPLVPDIDAEKYPAMIDGGVRFICNQLFPTWVYRLFGLEGRAEDTPKMVRSNVKLYQLMCHIRDRQKRLSRILTRGMARELGADEPGIRTPRADGVNLPMFGGCYLASASNDGGREPAFAAGVFDRVMKSQNFVSWTDQAMAHDAQHHGWATRGFTILGVLALAALAGLGYWIFTTFKSK